jgi:hypothetical protein
MLYQASMRYRKKKMLFPEELDRKTKYIFIKITFLKPTVLALIIKFLLEIVFGMLSTLFTFFFHFIDTIL